MLSHLLGPRGSLVCVAVIKYCPFAESIFHQNPLILVMVMTYVVVLMYLSACPMCVGACGGHSGHQSPGAGVLGRYEPPDMCARRSWGFRKSDTNPYSLSHLSGPMESLF